MPVAPVEPGQLLGDRYRIVRELGRGGMGVVYRGRDLARDMEIAIKLRTIPHPAATLWLKREFRAAAALRHPNLVELYELVAHDASCYFTMELVDGVDPREHCAIGTSDRVDVARVRSVIAQLAEALAFLHAHGVIHRDVKPSNVLVDGGGTAKLLDFGLALERARAKIDLEREARVVGTAAYLAPEYVEQLAVGPAMDVYSLGVVAYELLTGNRPAHGARLDPPPRPRAANAEVPPDLDDAIAAMLDPDPRNRPSALDVAARAGSPPRAMHRAARFVGRDAELARLVARIDDPAEHGRLVLVTGPSGVGKSALIETVIGLVRHRVVAWRGRCHERERVPYRAFDFVIDDLATELAYTPKLAARIEHAGALARVFPTLGAIAHAAGAAPSPPADDLRVERERGRLAMIELFRHVIAQPRAVLVLDDLQWADDDSLELLALLVERIARPLTIVASWTTGAPLAGVPAALLERLGPTAERVELAPMTAAALADVIAELAPHAPRAQLAEAAQLAAGSPYLAEVIGRELAADASGASVTSAERRRLDRLRPAERTIAEIAALAGGTATFEQLRAIAELPPALLHAALRDLEDARVIRRAPSAVGTSVYALYHQRLGDTATAALAPAARAAIHRRYAELGGEPAQLAYHWSEAGEPRAAARAAVAAADAARAQLAWALAADWYGRALAWGGPAVALAAERANALFLAGKLGDAADALLALGSARHRVRAAEAYIKLGEIERGIAILDGVLLDRGERRAAPFGSRGAFARGRARVASAIRSAGIAARLVLPMRVRRAKPADEIATAAYRVIARFLSTPYPIEAFEYVLRGIDGAARAGDRGEHALGMAMLGAYFAAGSLGRFGARAIAAAERLSRESGEPYPRMVAAGCGGILATLRGDWTAMRDAHEHGWRMCKQLGMERSWEASFLHMYWGLGELYAGEPARALAILAELADSDDMNARAVAGSIRGRALVLAGELEPARALAAELERSRAAQLGVAAIYRRVFAAELALAEHDWPRAAAIADELDATARAQWLAALPAVTAMIDVVQATAALGAGRLHVARDRARQLYRRGRASFYAATALRLWGQAEQLLGDEPRARRLLADARAAAIARGGLVDRLALARLAGELVDAGPLDAAVSWITGGIA